MLNDVAKFIRGRPVQRGMFLSAYWQLGRARWDLRSRPVRQLLSGFAAPGAAEDGQAPSAAQRDTAEAVGRAVRAAAVRTPWDSSCLVQVLAAQRMLRSRGIGGTVHIGADTEDELGYPGFAAHAWLMCGDLFVTGETGHERYTVVAEYRWDVPAK